MDTTALDQYIEAAIKEPVCIEKNGRKVAVLVSYEEYEQLQKADDYLLGLAAKLAQQESEEVPSTDGVQFLLDTAKKNGIDVDIQN